MLAPFISISIIVLYFFHWAAVRIRMDLFGCDFLFCAFLGTVVLVQMVAVAANTQTTISCIGIALFWLEEKNK